MNKLGPRTAALIAVVLLLLASFQLPSAGAADEVVNPQAGLVQDRFADGLRVREITFPGPGHNDQSAVVLPNHAFMTSATVNMTFGTFPGTNSAPWSPSLDVGIDGTVDWAFDSDRGGPVGLQDRFSDGSKEVEFEFSGDGGSQELFVELPRDIEITEAYVDVEGLPIPHWEKQYLLTPKTDSPGEYGPKMTYYNGDMWAIWQSADQNITDGGDSDIVVRRFDGARWDPHHIELTQKGDDLEDDIPQIIAFAGRLYAIWSKGDGMATPGGHSELVYRAYDGETWAPEERISGPREDGLNTYERCVVYDGRLYVFWKTTDPNYCVNEWDDLDIVYRAYDNESWGSIIEITAADNDGTDWSMDVTVFRGLLYVIWDTWETDITGSWGNVDVVYRAFDGQRWTSLKNLSPASDSSITSNDNHDALPRFYVWYNPATREDELFAIWMRGDSILGAGGDGYHIVYRRYTGSDWTPMEQLSSVPTGDPVDQMFPSLFAMNDTLYAIWVLGTNTTSYREGGVTLIATYGDVVIRSFDGEVWSPQLELTPWNNGYDDASHPSIYVYGGKIFVAWESPLESGHDTLSWEIVMRHLEIKPVTVRLTLGDTGDVVWGWQRLSNTKRRVQFDTEALTECINSQPFSTDRYGNKYTVLPITLADEAAASVKLSNLTIKYDYEVQVDFTGTSEAAVAEERDNTHVDKDVQVGFELTTGQAGRITLKDPILVYDLDYPPILIEDVPDQQVFEDEARSYLVNLASYFTDDWDNGSLLFTIIEERNPVESPSLIDAYLVDGSWLSVKLPAKDAFGVAMVKVRAHDRHPFYHNDSNDILIVVLNVNDAPVLSFIHNRELEVDVESVDILNATDADPDDNGRLVFTTDSEFVTIDPKTLRMSITMRTWYPKELYFNVTVTDPQGANDTQEVMYNFTAIRVTVATEDEFPYALLLLLLLVLALVVAERLRRPYRMSEEETIWDEEAEYEEGERVRASGQWWRRFF